MLPTHEVGTRTDLPLPITLAVLGAVLELVISFAALVTLWRRPRFTGGAHDRGCAAVPAAHRPIDSVSAAGGNGRAHQGAVGLLFAG